MKNVFLLIAIIMLASCVKDGQAVNVEGSKSDFCVEFLFEKDGLKIYRFIDGGELRYFSTGNGSFQPQRQTKQSGKTQTQYTDGVLN